MKTAFTLLEILMIVGIIALLAALAIPALHNFQLSSDLENSSQELINALRLAQQRTIASEGDSSWGVYFIAGGPPHQYVLFKGDSYLSRDASKDEIHKISGAVLISEINLGGMPEVIFSRISGDSSSQGSVVLVLKADSSKTKTVYIESSGQAGVNTPAAPSDINRLKDSRHVHLDYSRYIATTTENLILTFSYESSTQTEIIAIADKMKDGQIFWEGEFGVGGQIQKLKIHTHQLNQPGTQFSIHRDGRYNNRALKIKFSGDGSGNFIEYSADGLNTISSSIYASNIQWQ
jgi:Tfp pilus assembly protein FimT